MFDINTIKFAADQGFQDLPTAYCSEEYFDLTGRSVVIVDISSDSFDGNNFQVIAFDNDFSEENHIDVKTLKQAVAIANAFMLQD